MLTRIKPSLVLRAGAPGRYANGLRLALVLGSIQTLTACGFHLEGSVPGGQMPSTARVESIEPHSEFFMALETALRESGTRLVDADASAPATLKILEDNTGQRVLSVSARNIPREYEVFYRVTFSFEGTRGQLVEPQSLVATRSYTYDETRVLGKSAEEQQVRRAIAADLARQVVRRIAAAPPLLPAPQS